MSKLDFFQKDFSDNDVAPNVPFFALKGAKPDTILAWLKKEVNIRESAHSEFFRECYRNLQAYKGAYHKKPGRQTDSNSEVSPLNKYTSKYVVNHLYELTENMTSRMTRLKPAVDVLPSNDEYEDKVSAKAVELLLKHMMYLNDLDMVMQKAHRQRIIFGESFVEVFWNPELGDLHPDYIKLRASGKVDVLKASINKDTPIRVGDVALRSLLPWNVLLENCDDYEHSKSVIIKKLIHIDELRRDYPEHAKNLGIPKNNTHYSMNSLREENSGQRVWVYTFYHKADNDFPEGVKIEFSCDVILSKDKLGMSHGHFPILRLTDIEVPGALHGMSRYSQVLILQNAHNNLSQSVMKNEFLLSAPKWMMPKGACKVEQLGNGRTIVQYQGGVPPQLVQMNPTSQTTLGMRETIAIEMSTIFGVHQVSRGAPPTGITAAVALQFLNEQETERSVSDISKHNNFVVELAKMMISTAGDNYSIDDGRILRIFGKNNKHMVTSFDTDNLHKDYDVRLQLGSALPNSKSAHMERVIQTLQYDPTLLPPERWVELLEFGSIEKMHTLITEAINSAESEEEDILQGIEVEEPKEWEDHITHLRSHYKKMQSRYFKEEIPAEFRAEFIEHVKITEMLADERAQMNPLFASKLAQLDQYPMFYSLATVPQSAEQRQALVQGQANQGTEITTQIPATEPEDTKRGR